MHAIHTRKNREQSLLFPESLDQILEADNEVRIIDLFVESINSEEFKFIIKTTKEGCPAYHPKDLLKLFVYGYLNHIRSSRQLEKECKRNIELRWLIKQTIKRQWGFYYVITKRGMKRASADVGFMFITYNLRRLMNIVDKNQLAKFLKELVFLIFKILASVKAIILKMRRMIFYTTPAQTI